MSHNSPSDFSDVSLDRACVNTIRFLSIDAVQKANSGHPGMPMGAAPMAYVLWTRFLKHNPANPEWWDRDRFILSAGHGSMLLYSLLYLTGYDLPLEQIMNFRRMGSRTAGHPERGHTPGVEITTGPLGQGFANGVGMAMAEAWLAARYNQPGYELINHYTYALVGDGDLMEGISSEAASLAGHLKLGKLICLYDDNRVSLAGATDLAFREDCRKRFESYGWHALMVDDGNDLESIHAAIAAAKAETDRPSLIQIRTAIGYGSPNKQGSFESHGAPLGVEEVKLTKRNLGWPEEPPFHVPRQSLDLFRRALNEGKAAEAKWSSRFADYLELFPLLGEELQRAMRGEPAAGWEAQIPFFDADSKGMATRAASGKVLNAIASALPNLIGGSADLNPSTQTVIENGGDFQHPDFIPADRQGATGGAWGYLGRNLHFGVREHAMGAIANGMAAHGGVIPYAATFFVFSDYMRPPIRLAALMGLGTIFVFTHDSIGVGEDGPTHQPVEHLAALRAIPGLIVIRPCDANETAVAWRVALECRNMPVAMVLTRQAVPTLDRNVYAAAEGLRYGAYILADAGNKTPDIILIATGSEVQLILAAREKLAEEGVAARAVSMPSWELFNAQPSGYRDAVLPPSVKKRLVVEAGIPQGWGRYVGDMNDIIAVSHFGVSAPGNAVFEKFGFTVENVVARAKRLLSH
ncbi:MAG TPA: transketolase [Acidobacteriota bacterium]|nr:transketolase [Acidobacteriota bacterium]